MKSTLKMPFYTGRIAKNKIWIVFLRVPGLKVILNRYSEPSKQILNGLNVIHNERGYLYNIRDQAKIVAREKEIERKETKHLQDYTEQLKEQLKQLEEIKHKLNRRIKKLGEIPKGVIKLSASAGYAQYYLKEPGEKKFRYVKVDEMDDVKKIAQYDYYEKVLKQLKRQQKALEIFLKHYDITQIDKLYTNASEGRKVFIDPIIKPDDEYIEHWYGQFVGRQNGFQEERIFKTDRGEMVRSKSEKIIADMLLKFGIPYVYEPCIRLDNGQEVFPDFATLNVKKRKTVLWEHLGRLGEYEYARKNSLKVLDYERDGCIEGDTLITTKESDKKPLDVELVEKKIRLFLM